MTTTTSFSKKDRFIGCYKSTFRRSVGYFGLFAALIAVFYPFQYATEAFKATTPDYLDYANHSLMQYYDFLGLGMNYTVISVIFFSMIMLLMPLILALVMNSYMHSKKAADVYHALPVERGMLLTVNLAVSMTFIAVPVVLSSLLIGLMQVIKFGVYPFLLGNLVLDTLGWLVCALAIYVITTFVCTMAGTVFDTLLFSGTVLGSAPILVGIYFGLASLFLFGFDMNNDILYHIFNLSPVSLMLFRQGASDLDWADGIPALYPGSQRMLGFSNLALAVWLAISIVVFLAAIRLYRRRNSEMAETTTSKGVLPMLIKFVGTFVCASCVGMLFFAANNADNKLIYVTWTIIGGLLTYIILEAILNRGFKTLVRSLPLGLIMVGVTVGASVVLMTGGLGYENRVPAADRVASVTVNYRGRYGNDNYVYTVDPENPETPNHDNRSYRVPDVTLTSPENIETVRAFHQDILSRHIDPYQGYALEDEREKVIFTNTKITYTLKNGAKVSRRYFGISDSTLALMAPLEASEEFNRRTHPAFFTQAKNVRSWRLSNIYGSKSVETALSVADSQALLEAMQADLLAQTVQEMKTPTQSPVATLNFGNDLPVEGAELAAYDGNFIVLNGGKTAAFLQQKGLLEQVEPDLDDCYAVIADMDEGRYGQYPSSIRLIMDEDFQTAEFESIKQNILHTQSYKENNPDLFDGDTLNTEAEAAYDFAASRDYAIDNSILTENPETIRLMAAQVVGSYDLREPLVYAKFYFKNAETGNAVLIPFDRLPQELQSQFSSYVR